jgi:hypothetical protein
MVLAWPGPSIVVAETLFGFYCWCAGSPNCFCRSPLPESAAALVVLFIAGALSAPSGWRRETANACPSTPLDMASSISGAAGARKTMIGSQSALPRLLHLATISPDRQQ